MIWTRGALVALLCGPAFPAFAAGDAEHGRVIAERWCVACHAGRSATTASDAAPPLREIAKQRDGTQEGWRTWLSNPHPPMPNPGLGRQDIEDVVAYLIRLRSQ